MTAHRAVATTIRRAIGLWPLSFLLLNVIVDLVLENLERQRTILQHGFVKLALVEFIAELLLRARSQFLDLQHSNFVSAGLARIDDVTLDLRFHFFLAHAGFVAHVSDRLIAWPMFGVNSGIDD